MNKKANTPYDLAIKLEIGLFIFILAILFLASMMTIYEDKNKNKEICKELNMEVLLESSGNFFTNSQLTCWDKTTKEVKVIR